ncbi:MAG: hypothetical protein AAF914_03535, partial [Pseudomonadota bacterium]
ADRLARLSSATLLSAAAVGSAVFALAVFGFGIALPPGTVALIILSDCFFARLVHVQSFVLLAQGRSGATAANDVVFAALRAGAAVLFVALIPQGGAAAWAPFYLAASVLSALVAMSWTRRALYAAGLGVFVRRDVVDGAAFAGGTAAHMMRRQIDRPLAEALLSGPTAGNYAAAARLAEAAMLPIATVFRVTYRRFFAAGASPSPAMRGLVLRLAALLALACLGVGVGLWIVADNITLVLGPEFADAGDALRVLALLPFIHAANNLMGDALSGLGRQWDRTLCEAVALAAKVAIIVALAQQGSDLVWFAGLVCLCDASATLAMVWRSATSLPTREQVAHGE